MSGLLPVEQPIQVGPADLGALGDLRSGHAVFQRLTCCLRDFLHGSALVIAGASELFSQPVQAPAGLNVGRVLEHVGTVTGLQASVKSVTLCESTKRPRTVRAAGGMDRPKQEVRHGRA